MGINRRFSGWAVSAEYVNRPHDRNATQVAEMVKLFENTFRSVNIALVEIIETLQARGAQVDYADPRVAQVQVGGHLLKAVAREPADLAAYDLALLLTTHPEFDPRRLVAEARLVVDTRNATGPLGAHRHVIRI